MQMIQQTPSYTKEVVNMVIELDRLAKMAYANHKDIHSIACIHQAFKTSSIKQARNLYEVIIAGDVEVDAILWGGPPCK